MNVTHHKPHATESPLEFVHRQRPSPRHELAEDRPGPVPHPPVFDLQQRPRHAYVVLDADLDQPIGQPEIHRHRPVHHPYVTPPRRQHLAQRLGGHGAPFMSADTITLTRQGDRWFAIDEASGVTASGGTRAQALESLDDAVAGGAPHDEVAIVRTPDVLHGQPRIDGTRLGVFTIGESVRRGD